MILSGTLNVDLELQITKETFELETAPSEDSIFLMDLEPLQDSNAFSFDILEEIVTQDLDVDTKIVVNHIEGETYKGPYRVIPDFSDQNLETKNKVMTQNVEVTAIPVSRVSNQQGGRTVYIGGIL